MKELKKRVHAPWHIKNTKYQCNKETGEITEIYETYYTLSTPDKIIRISEKQFDATRKRYNLSATADYKRLTPDDYGYIFCEKWYIDKLKRFHLERTMVSQTKNFDKPIDNTFKT